MMNDDSLRTLQKLVIAFREERDWGQFHQIKDLLLGLQIEVAELSEHFLWKSPEDSVRLAAEEDGQRAIGEELADIQIFLLYLAEATGIDLADAVRRKVEVNRRRYPVEKARGSARKYTKLRESGSSK
jgi:NTP pyrophosphatase (non-canonical NTP hydrolase)